MSSYLIASCPQIPINSKQGNSSLRKQTRREAKMLYWMPHGKTSKMRGG